MDAETTTEETSKRVRKRSGKAGAAAPSTEVEAARRIITTRETVDARELRPGPQQYRKHFDEKKLAELAESIRRLGVQQPIWARLAADGIGYEIIAGERRWRAARVAGLESLVVDVKTFEDGAPVDDETALELAIVENNQRSDPHPLEECDAFVAMRDRYGHTAEQIAAKIRRSTGYVYERLALEHLGEAARAEMWAGHFPLAVAHALSRVSHPKTQDLAVKELVRNHEDGTPVNVAWAKNLIVRNYMLRIADAPFETADVDLVPEAGACGACPKRSGNQGMLFESAGFGRTDVCTDLGCWNAKKKASDDRTLALAKASGKEVVTKAQAKKDGLFSYGDRLQSKTLIDLDERDYQLTGDKSWRHVLGARIEQIEPVYVQAPSGKLITAAKRAKVIAVLKATPAATDTAGVKELRKPKAKSASKTATPRNAEPSKFDIKRECERLAVTQLVGEVERDEHGPDRAGEISRAIVLAMASNVAEIGELGTVARRRGWIAEGADTSTREDFALFLERVPEMSMAELRGLCVELAIQFSFGEHFNPGARIFAIAGIDPASFEKAARAALAARAAAEQSAPKGKGRKAVQDEAAADDEEE